MAWILGIIILLAMGAFAVFQYRESQAEAERQHRASRSRVQDHGDHETH